MEKTGQKNEWLTGEPRYLRAWTDILRLTETKDRSVRRGGRKVSLKAGVAYISKRALARKWGWSHDSVDLFLERLSLDGLIDVASSPRGKTEVRVLNRFEDKREDLLSHRLESFKPVDAMSFPITKGEDIEIAIDQKDLPEDFEVPEAQLGAQLGAQIMQNEPKTDEKEPQKGGIIGGLNTVSKDINNPINILYGDRGMGEEDPYRNLPKDRPIPTLPEKKHRFKKPTIEEVREYVEKKGYEVDPEAFWFYYESRGWRVGKNNTPMASWQGAVGTWMRNRRAGWDENPKLKREKEVLEVKKKLAKSFRNFEERDTDYDELIRKLNGD